MAPSAVPKEKPKKSLIYVMGQDWPARQIGQELADLGFSPKFSNDYPGITWPELSSPSLLQELKVLMEHFKKKSVQWIHPGVTDWGSYPELVLAAQESGVTVISPPARSIGQMTNRLSLFNQAEKLKIPNLVLSTDLLSNANELRDALTKMNLKTPIVLKTVRGGVSGSEVRVLRNEDEIERDIPIWLEQLERRFGEVFFFTEAYVRGARMIRFPFVRFSTGKMKYFSPIDSTLQTRFRKIIEICPAQEIQESLHEQIQKWIQLLAQAIGFTGVGIFEFIVDHTKAYLVDALPRLNLNYELWESQENTRAVSWQIFSQSGDKPFGLDDEEKVSNSVQVKIQIYAEDPILNLPRPGVIHEMELRDLGRSELAIDVHWDSLTHVGESVSQHSNGLVGVLSVKAPQLKEALKSTKNALEKLWICGSLQTNQNFLLQLLDQSQIQQGFWHSTYVDDEFVFALNPPKNWIPVFAHVCAYFHDDPQNKWSVGAKWVDIPSEELVWMDGPHVWNKNGISGTLLLDQKNSIRVCAFPLSENIWQVQLGTWTALVRKQNRDQAAKNQAEGLFPLYALGQGTVDSVLFREGSVIAPGEPLLLVESLGRLVPHAVPISVKIQNWNVKSGQSIQQGDVLGILKKL